MDDMTIIDPKTGAARYRIGKDLEVEDLNDPPRCRHSEDSKTHCCGKCGAQLEINNQ